MGVPNRINESEQLREALLDLARAHAHERETSAEAEALLVGLRSLTSVGHVSMFDHFLSVLRELIAFEDAGILVAQDGSELRAVASTSARFDQITWTTDAMLTHVSVCRARTIFDVSSVPEWQAQPASVRAGVTSALHVLLQEEPVLAILVCTHPERGAFGEQHARLAARFAPLASHALANYEYTRQLEQLNRQLNQEIVERQRAEELAATRQVQVMNTAKMAALGEMAGGVAHEINTPLAVIALLAQQLREVTAAGPIDRAALDAGLARIERTSQRIARVVRSLLTFSREADADSPSPALVQSLIDDTLELCRERFIKHGVELIVDEVPADLTITCRAPQISQVLLNLLINAFDAVVGASPKWVRVTVRGLATGVEIAVTDSGPGIPDDLRQRIFQPFFTTKPVGKGVGLGLSISGALVEGHAGSLTIDPSSKHTRFIMRLPYGKGPSDDVGDRWRVLVVDDDEDLREIVAEDFIQRGYDVRTAAGGDEAFRLVQQAPVDLVLSDLRMPSGDGIDLLKHIVALKAPRPDVILMTGFADLNSEQAHALGAAALVGKPFDRSALFATVRALQAARGG